MFHLVMFNIQSTYLLKLTVRLSLQFCLFTSERPLRRVLLYCISSPLFTLLVFALVRISLFILCNPIIWIPRWADINWRNKVVRINEVWLCHWLWSVFSLYWKAVMFRTVLQPSCCDPPRSSHWQINLFALSVKRQCSRIRFIHSW